jgi:hypothetical protein
MCNNKKLPPVGYAQQVMLNLAAVNGPSADLAAAIGIETAALEERPVDNDFLAHETEEVGELAYGMNELQINGILVDRGTRALVDYAYDEIFKAFMPRRADRSSHEPTGPHRELIKQWLDNVHSRRLDRELGLEDLINGLKDLEFIPKVSKCFTSMIRSCLPAKLDFSSWVGEMVKQKLITDGAGTFNTGQLIIWQQSMGRGFGTQMAREQARLDRCLPFIGRGGPDRLVWRENEFGVHKNIRPDIEVLLEGAERSLVALSIQIANWLAWCIFKEHAEPMSNMRVKVALTSGDIIEAVVEILGDAWFKLPFDDDNLLKQWKFERVLPCALEEYLDVVDDHKDEGDSDDEDDQSNEDGDESDETGSSNYQSDEAIFM